MEWLFQNPLWAVVVYVALTAMQLAVRRVRLVNELRLPLNILFLLAATDIFCGETIKSSYPDFLKAIEVTLFALIAFIGIRLLDLFLFSFLVPRRTRKPVPVVLRDIVKWLLFAVAVFVILRMLFPDIDFSVLAVSSIVVGYILGNASQDTLGNLFAGLALNTESPFSIGDWVQIGEFSGKVIDMTWRATRLQTKEHDHIIIPNSTIAREFIINYSRPTLSHGFKLKIGVNYEVPPNTVRETLVAACKAVPEILSQPRPLVWLHEYDDFSINYTLKFYITDFEELETIQSDLMNLVWYYFKRAGIVIPFPIRDVRLIDQVQAKAEAQRGADREDYRRIVDAISIFGPLSPEERERLVDSLREEIFGDGEVLVREGDPGNTFYIVREGQVSVRVGSGSRQASVATLNRGDFFGEMSLLTGEKRSATIVADGDTKVLVLAHTFLHGLLENNTALAGALATELEKRSRQQEALREKAPKRSDSKPPEPVSEQDIFARICKFFRI